MFNNLQQWAVYATPILVSFIKHIHSIPKKTVMMGVFYINVLFVAYNVALLEIKSTIQLR